MDIFDMLFTTFFYAGFVATLDLKERRKAEKRKCEQFFILKKITYNQDAFLKKEWYVVKVPKFIDMKDEEFKYRVGYTPAKKGGAKKQLEGRTFTINLADLEEPPKIKKADHERERNRRPNRNDCKNFSFVAEEVHGQQLLTQWSGMEITRNYRCSLIRKWHSMVECILDAKTTDGYVLRIKAVAFTRRQPEQVKKTCYAKNSQVLSSEDIDCIGYMLLMQMMYLRVEKK
ncbi:hypothetical protein RFI_18791 [Reticulomyxa filosa]|uniref:Uncharacterized protein n=1 Tax=Reticulomyxa filosa TaxID=46433 RepID=X6MZI6_RETFI|nr:hypothetical protein RFI_18791 [Reticulomyxa filosa]|eukprot:ETO18475.1 hypothetical protein RFI_18791 [Reticulomyxa filosa]